MTRRLWIILPLILIILCGAVWLRHPPVQTCRLPDGTVLYLDAATYGTQHRAPIPPDQWWRRMLPFLNRRRPTSYRTQKPTLVLWLSAHQGRTRKTLWEPIFSSCCGPPLYDMDISDELGHHLRVDNTLSRPWPNPGYDGYVVELSTFPRRGKTVTVTFPGKVGDAREFFPQPSGRLTVPNPTPGPYPHWDPSPLPVTQQSGNVAVTLTSLTRPKDMLGIPAPGGGVFVATEGEPEMLASFQVTQSSRPTRDWCPVGVAATDTAGQQSQLSGGFPSSGFQPTPQGWQLVFPAYLPDDEAGYKFRFEFRSRAPVAYTTMTVPIPVNEAYWGTATTGQSLLMLPTESRPIPLRISCVASGSVHLQLDCYPPRQDLNWLIHLTDDHGKWIQPQVKRFRGMPPDPYPGWTASQQWTESGSASSLNTFDMPVPPGAKRLHLTIGTVQSRWVDFTARPS